MGIIHATTTAASLGRCVFPVQTTDEYGNFSRDFADRFTEAFGLKTLIFKAPDKRSRFALLNRFGPEVHLCNVRLEENLRVEIYRRAYIPIPFQKTI